MNAHELTIRRRAYALAKSRGIEVVFNPDLEETPTRTDKSSLVEVRIDSAEPTSRADAAESMARVRNNYESAHKKHRRAKATAQPKVKADAAEPQRQALPPSSIGYAGSQYRF